ncbi:hypothetical protein BU17DRAFT_65499 [Hysterangium stoloniferum]|nr:hypothetical protein BU17DRAFT_65499 [Hysterangium stoloniferum]
MTTTDEDDNHREDLVAQLDTIFMIHQLIQHWIFAQLLYGNINTCVFNHNLLKTLLNTNKLMVQPTHAVFVTKVSGWQAHENKVPLCVTNLAKIKTELLVDAFLLPGDPLTLAEGE